MVSVAFIAEAMAEAAGIPELKIHIAHVIDHRRKCLAIHATRRGIVRTVLPERVSAREDASANSAWSLHPLEILS